MLNCMSTISSEDSPNSMTRVSVTSSSSLISAIGRIENGCGKQRKHGGMRIKALSLSQSYLLDLHSDLVDAQEQVADGCCGEYADPVELVPNRKRNKYQPQEQKPRGVAAVKETGRSDFVSSDR